MSINSCQWPGIESNGTGEHGQLCPGMQTEIFLHEVKKGPYGRHRGPLPVPGELYRSGRQRGREVKGNEAASWRSDDRLGKGSNPHPLRDQRAYHAHVPTLKDDLREKTGLMRQ